MDFGILGVSWEVYCFFLGPLFITLRDPLNNVNFYFQSPHSINFYPKSSTESFSRTLAEALLLKTISSCLADMALSESMIMFHGWPHCPFS